MKKIFIIVPQALVIRNILRSGVLELLKKSGHTIYLFVSCKKIPGYIAEEFSAPQVKMIAVPNSSIKIGKIHKLFILFTHFLNDNASTRVYFRYSRHYIDRSKAELFLYSVALSVFSRIPLIKPLVRLVERVFFVEKKEYISAYFDRYRPDLLFSTSITSKIDNIFIKEAKRRRIKTVSMTKSWDNATKMYYRVAPDYLLVQNNIVKESAVGIQDISRERVYSVGFPQFDWYAKKEIITRREDHLAEKGLDPKLPLIFFGSQGVWYKKDFMIAEKIHKWIMNDELVKPCQMIIRPHFSNVKETVFDQFRGRERVACDDSYKISYDFIDNWDPTVPEIIDFANTLAYSDAVVIMLSTIALDAACFDRPVINALFGGTYQRGIDVTDKLAQVVHYQWIFDTDGVTPARSFGELKKAINTSLEHPEYKAKGRNQIREQLCYGVDGNSSRRIADAIEKILRM